MTIEIMNYDDTTKEVDIGELKDISSMKVRVVSGDEILEVKYKDGTEKVFDSSDDRTRDYYDGFYTLYDEEKGVNEMENDKWIDRTHYSYLEEFGDTSDANSSWDWYDVIFG